MTIPTNYGTKYSRAILAFLVVFAIYQLILGGLLILLNLHANDATDAVKDCTVSTGQCYKDSNRRTGSAIQNLNVNTIATIACSQTNKGFTEIKQCVENTLRALQDQTQSK